MNEKDFVDEHLDRSKKYNLFATRGNLNDMQKQLKQARRGATTCKSLKDIIRLKVKLYLAAYEKDLLKMTGLLEAANFAYQRARYDGPNYGPFIIASVDKAQKKVLRQSYDWCGFHTYSFELSETDVPYPFSLLGLATSGHQLLKVRAKYAEVLQCVVNICSLRNEINEATILFGQIGRRFNGLTKAVLPKVTNTIQYITSELEENERFEFFSMKLMKRKRMRVLSDQMNMELEKKLEETSEDAVDTSGMEVKTTRSSRRFSRPQDLLKSGLIPFIQESIFGILPISRITFSTLRGISNESILASWAEEQSQFEFSSSEEKSSISEVISITDEARLNQSLVDEQSRLLKLSSGNISRMTREQSRESVVPSPTRSEIDGCKCFNLSSETLNSLASPDDLLQKLPSVITYKSRLISDTPRNPSRTDQRVSFFVDSKTKRSSLIETKYSVDQRSKTTVVNLSDMSIEKLITVKNNVSFSPELNKPVELGASEIPKYTFEKEDSIDQYPPYSISESVMLHKQSTDEASLRSVEGELESTTKWEDSRSSKNVSVTLNRDIMHNTSVEFEENIQTHNFHCSTYSTVQNFDGTPYLSALDGPAILARFCAQLLSRLLRNLIQSEDDQDDEAPAENPSSPR